MYVELDRHFVRFYFSQLNDMLLIMLKSIKIDFLKKLKAIGYYT